MRKTQTITFKRASTIKATYPTGKVRAAFLTATNVQLMVTSNSTEKLSCNLYPRRYGEAIPDNAGKVCDLYDYSTGRLVGEIYSDCYVEP